MKRKTAYLTIDDVPSKDFPGKMEYLLKKGIPAILFCPGQNLEGKKDWMV
ncbi:MAG: hypothetical protein PF447_08375 [Spirochaetaceae bacterium]|jgi:peptidoglycan/xylan/chitin deacetylase (PgdA/CDA1 family)|nr:hypothetical protein [Spirochaetaceae bacterium]